MYNSFALNVANINALIGLTCSAVSHNWNERRSMIYEDSATFFHQWHTVSTSSGFTVSGFCGLPLPSLQQEMLDPYKIDLRFTRAAGDDYGVTVRGKLAGKSIALEFSNNHFLDTTCANPEVYINRLSEVLVGSSMDSVLSSILDSRRSPFSLHLLENESWVQGNAMTTFSGIGSHYRMAQYISGRQLGFAVTASQSGAELHLRSANYLEYAESTNFYALAKDDFGFPKGFLDPNLPVNHKFSAYPIQNGAQMRGCSLLIYDGELDRPQDLDIYACFKYMDKYKTVSSLRQSKYESQSTIEERENREQRIEIEKLRQRIEAYLSKTVGPLKRYSKKPGVYETGLVAWSATDKSRGYVVFQRSFTVNSDTNEASVIEYRYDNNGNEIKKSYAISLDSI